MNKSDKLNISDKVGLSTARSAEIIERSSYDGYIDVVVTRVDGSVEKHERVHNTRTNNGAAFWYQQLSTTPSTAALAFLALSSSTLTIALTDASLVGIISTNGCGITAASVGGYVGPTGVTAGAAQGFTYTLSHTWTNTTSATTVNSAGALTALASGVLVLESNLSTSVTLQVGDSLQLTWSITS